MNYMNPKKIIIHKTLVNGLLYFIPFKDLELNPKFWNELRRKIKNNKRRKKYAKITIEI